jgi:hypothetical protein
MRRDAERAGCSFFALPDDFDDPDGYVLDDDWDSYDAKICGAALAEAVPPACEASGADVLVVDCLCLSAISAAEQLSLPTAVVVHFIIFEWVRDEPEGFNHWVDLVNATRSTLDLDRLPLGTGLIELWRRADVVLNLPPPWWMDSDLPDNVQLVGPIANEPSIADEWDLPWPPDDETPLIVISLSTTYMRQEMVLERLAAAAAGLAAHTVVSLSRCVSREAVRMPSGVEVRDWLNLGAVLPHADLLVTHGGQATTSAGMSHGVPLLIHPLSRDQFRVADHVATDGAGLVVDEEASVSALRESMRALLNEDSFRAVGGIQAAELERLGNGRLAITALEELVPGR